jgi:murein DD-endopeptidase MepM/ murein hydrolase activator NlpD
LLADPRFARAAYALFGVAVLAALLKLGGVSGVQPLVLRAAPVPKAEEAAAGEKVSGGERLVIPDVGRLSTKMVESPARLKAQNDAPVFYRPSPGSTREANGDSDEPVCGDLGDFPKSSKAVFPLPGAYFNSYEDTWGAARPQGAHEGTDLMSSAGTPEFAITDGTIVPVSGANKNGWNRLGGYTVMLEAAYDVGPIEKGDLFYYAHMDQKSTLPIGTKVQAGQQIGVVGDTGEGPEITQGKFPPHLHLGWYDTSSASVRTNLKSGAMNPYPLLLWLEENGGAVTGGTDAAYCKAPQGPTPDLPGVRPDLDPGNAYDTRPSPIIGEGRQYDNRFPEENGSGSGPDEKDRSNRVGGRIGATDGDSNVGPTDRSGREDRTSGSHDRTSAPAEAGPAASKDHASRSSVEDNSSGAKTREKNRTFLPDRLRPGRTTRRYHASILAHALRRAEIRKSGIAKDRDGRDADTLEKEKRKKFSNPLERGEPKENRSTPETGAAQPVPGKKDARNAPGLKEDPEASLKPPDTKKGAPQASTPTPSGTSPKRE